MSCHFPTPASAARVCIRGLARAFFFWGAVVGATSATAQETWQEDIGSFADGLVTTVLDQQAVAGAVVTVVTGDEVLFSRGYRLADARTDRQMTTDKDVIPLASVTKVFTSLAIMQLVDTGAIALQDPIAQHLPDLELNQPFGEITIAHLLGHSARLDERFSGYFATPRDLVDAPAIARISAVLPQQTRPPADVISYSNASYVLLGQIVAQVTGQSFDDYIADQILAPLNIENSRFLHNLPRVVPERSDAASPFHVWDNGRYVAIDPSPLPMIHMASGGLAVTTQDMGRFMQMLLRDGQVDGAEIFPRTTIAQMRDPIWPGRAEFSGRTLGFWTETWAGHAVYHHGGAHFGFHTMMVLVPSLDLAFFVAGNSPNSGALTGLPRRVLREVITTDRSQNNTTTIDCDAICLSAYTRRFITTRRIDEGIDRLRLFKPHIMSIAKTDDEMLLVSGLGYSRRFAPKGEDQFETPEGDMHLAFRRNGAGTVSLAHINGGIHSFDRFGFWRMPASILSGMMTAFMGSFLCLAAAFVAWRSRRKAISAPLVFGLLGIGSTAATATAVRYLLQTPEVAYIPLSVPLLWSVSGAYGVAVATVLAATVWLVRSGGKTPATRTERLLILSALPLFVWALATAWEWNLPVAAFTW